jgi:hypothetical protein
LSLASIPNPRFASRNHVFFHMHTNL